MTQTSYSDETLADFRRVQHLAYEAAAAVAAGLTPGVTERQAAQRLGDTLERQGVSSYFHQPFAWFGPRAMFEGLRTPLDFFPTDTPLERGMGGILDVAPILEGIAVDIGYTFGDSPQVLAQLRDLKQFRTLILEQVLAERSMREIYASVDVALRELGYVNCHRRYPFAVLAHKVDKVATVPFAQKTRLFGFGLPSGLPLLGRALAARMTGERLGSAFWNGGAGAKRRPQAGLWAVEPHIGKDGVGAKWEELLVITPSTAFWLDDDLPHVKSWSRPPGEQYAHA